MKKIIILCVVLVATLPSFAQKTKCGHVDTNSIFALHARRETATKTVKEYAITFRLNYKLCLKS